MMRRKEAYDLHLYILDAGLHMTSIENYTIMYPIKASMCRTLSTHVYLFDTCSLQNKLPTIKQMNTKSVSS